MATFALDIGLILQIAGHAGPVLRHQIGGKCPADRGGDIIKSVIYRTRCRVITKRVTGNTFAAEVVAAGAGDLVFKCRGMSGQVEIIDLAGVAKYAEIMALPEIFCAIGAIGKTQGFIREYDVGFNFVIDQVGGGEIERTDNIRLEHGTSGHEKSDSVATVIGGYGIA